MPPRSPRIVAKPSQTPDELASVIRQFFAEQPEAAVLEDGKVMFTMREAKYALSTDHGRCSLQLWNEERNMVRRVVSAAARDGMLRLHTQRFGQTTTKALELVSSRERRTPNSRDSARTRYLRLLERVLTREFSDWKSQGFRAAMDLHRSFGPAYVRGSLVRGKEAWAVIGVDENETASTMDGILTLGILWLHHCREQAGGRRLYRGLKLVLPLGAATLTLSRLAWMNDKAAQWDLYELDQRSEELVQRDPADTGNLHTRLVHHPDGRLARERFSDAITQVMALLPEQEHARVEQRLRSSTELAFLLHGLEFGRARLRLLPNSFAHNLEITFGVGESETPLTEGNRKEITSLVNDLFQRRRAFVEAPDFSRRSVAPGRRIGAPQRGAAHARLRTDATDTGSESNPAQDPLYRAAPERWLESVLRADLSPLTRGLAAETSRPSAGARSTEEDEDTRGNRVDVDEMHTGGSIDLASRVIPRLDPAHVYTQVPAIAGAGDRGMLDLLGVTADGRLAVIELKADDDLHFALQGLDYWIRVRHHLAASVEVTSGLGEFQRHGYFVDVELSPLPPRLYLAAPALHIHPATEVVLRYLSPRVEWHLLALDERWRQHIRVVWRKSNASL